MALEAGGRGMRRGELVPIREESAFRKERKTKQIKEKKMRKSGLVEGNNSSPAEHAGSQHKTRQRISTIGEEGSLGAPTTID